MPRGKSSPGGACPGERVYQGGHAPGQGFTRGGMAGMPRGKGLPGGACHGARDFTRGGIAPGQGFLPGGALPPYAPPVATSLRSNSSIYSILRLIEQPVNRVNRLIGSFFPGTESSQ